MTGTKTSTTKPMTAPPIERVRFRFGIAKEPQTITATIKVLAR